jgi:hypothetical protein
MRGEGISSVDDDEEAKWRPEMAEAVTARRAGRAIVNFILSLVECYRYLRKGM